MNRWSTTPALNQGRAKRAFLGTLVVVMAVSAPIQMAQVVHANNYDARIRALQAEVDQYKAQAAEVGERASTLQAELDRLTNERAILQKQIDLKQAEYEQTVASIAENEKKIADNQDVLGDTLANLYVEGRISSLEMLASSQNIGDYVDKQEYRSSVRDQLTRTIAEVKRLKAELEKQKIEAERILADQRAQREVLASKEAEQQQLVDQTRGEEAAYQKLSGDKQKEVDRLRAEQVAANMRAARRGNSMTLVAGTPGGGGYPGVWANAPMNSYVDDWGLYSRQCVSYAAWKVASTGRFVPHFGGRGNANQWEAKVAEYGITSGSTPRVGSVAVLYEGAYGHVMYVEEVSADGSRITISEYNYGWSGLYTKRSISSAGLRYLYF